MPESAPDRSGENVVPVRPQDTPFHKKLSDNSLCIHISIRICCKVDKQMCTYQALLSD
jgi:hypothetical protein